MSWKRNLLEAAVSVVGRFAPGAAEAPANPRGIFVLRNNDLGDLLVITPLFEALRKRFPEARIVAGVGSWAAEILKRNPFVDEILPINAPWHNQRIHPQGLWPACAYLARSREARELARRRFDIGIDVLGSPFGSLLLARAGIPWRLGVCGYAGGHSAAQQCIRFDAATHVGRSALGFAELLGATELPESRPQIFLEAPPAAHGAVVVAPGGGFAEKCWPIEHFAALLDRLGPRRVQVLGGSAETRVGAQLADGRPWVEDCTGKLSLEETFRVIAGALLVICNPSMAMHAAAAFRKPCVVLLGEHFADADAHGRQWGYEETRNLGRSAEHPAIWTPEEAWPIITETLARR